MASIDEIVSRLNMSPHPEGGYFVETFRDDSVHLSLDSLPADGRFKVGRPVSTCIYFLMPAGKVSHLHRMPSSEVWHFYAGDPLTVVELSEADGSVRQTQLGSDLAAGQTFQHVVRPGVWFGAFPSLDAAGGAAEAAASPSGCRGFSLVGCTVAPAFEFADFELADRAALLRQFPTAEEAILRLT